MSDTTTATPDPSTGPPPSPGDLAGNYRRLEDFLQRKRAQAAPVLQSLKDTQAKTQKMEADEAARPEVTETAPPEVPAPDPIRGFGSAASVFAMLASALTHTPMMTAMSSMAAAINARNANDQKAYEQHYRQWKDQTDQALKIDAAHRAKVQEALTLMQTDMAAGQAMLRAVDTEYQDQQSLTLGMANLWTQREQLNTARETAAMQMKRTQQEIDENAPKAFAGANLAAALKSGDPTKIAIAQEQMRIAASFGGNVSVTPFVGGDGKTYLMRKDAQGNISWSTPSGEPAMPPESMTRIGGPLSPASQRDKDIRTLADAKIAEMNAAHQAAGQPTLSEAEQATVRLDTQMIRAATDAAAKAKDVGELKNTLKEQYDAKNMLNAEAADMEAKQLLLTGQMPALGMSNSTIRMQIINRAAEIAYSEGHTIEDYMAGRATWKADVSSIAQITKIADAVTAFEQTAERNMRVAESLMNKGSGTPLGPVINRWLQAGRTATGDPDVAAFNTAMGTAATEYGKVISGGSASIAATPEGAREDAKEWLDRVQSPEAMKQQFTVARKDMANRKNSLFEQRAAIQKRISVPLVPVSPASGVQPDTGGWSIQRVQ